MESRVVKASKFLGLGILLYPIAYSSLNFVLPILIGVLGNENHFLVTGLEIITWFVLPIFSVFYLLAFHQLAGALRKWQKFVGYMMVSTAVIAEVLLPFIDRGLVSSSISFLAHMAELVILSGCLLAIGSQMEQSGDVGCNA
ncbi:TPA: hypothetical protein ACGUVR_004579 [Vibrio vulnificus]